MSWRHNSFQKESMGQAEPKPSFKPKARVFVVEDNIDSVRALALLLDVMGYDVNYAINGTAAINMAIAFRPDVIFLDLLLPDGHGAQVCAEMRKQPQLRDTRIFGISASSRMIDLQRALDAGCTDVLRKPVSPETFERLISGGMSRRALRDFIAKQSDKKGE